MMMMEFTGAKSREWVGSFGMCGLWSMGGVVIGMDGAVDFAFRIPRCAISNSS